ncbi:MAG TPA: hypothetical protein VFF04_04465 [Candidatus Babeliales bacterium]|nr:hypothetical protein [Candidatus Babeliales bacterium]
MQLIKIIGLATVLLPGITIHAADTKKLQDLSGMNPDTVYDMGFFGPFSIAGYDAMMAAYKQAKLAASAALVSEPKEKEKKKVEVTDEQAKKKLDQNAASVYDQRALGRLGLDVPVYRADQHTESMAAIARYNEAKKRQKEYFAKYS